MEIPREVAIEYMDRLRRSHKKNKRTGPFSMSSDDIQMLMTTRKKQMELMRGSILGECVTSGAPYVETD